MNFRNLGILTDRFGLVKSVVFDILILPSAGVGERGDVHRTLVLKE